MDKKAHLEAMRKAYEAKQTASHVSEDIDAVVSQQTKERLEKARAQTGEAARIAIEKGKVAARVASEKGKLVAGVLVVKGGEVRDRLSSFLGALQAGTALSRSRIGAVRLPWKALAVGAVVLLGVSVSILLWSRTPSASRVPVVITQSAGVAEVKQVAKPQSQLPVVAKQVSPTPVVAPVQVLEPVVAPAQEPSAHTHAKAAPEHKPVVEAEQIPVPQKPVAKKTPVKKSDPENDWQDTANSDLDNYMKNL